MSEVKYPFEEGKMWVVWYQDPSVPPEIFTGYGAEEAARDFFNYARGHWSVILLHEEARS